MTKYILVGGYPHKAGDGGNAFVRELVKGHGDKPRILDCLFARPRENWDKAHEQDVQFFTTHLGANTFEIRRAETESFIEQVIWADVVYMRGGSDSLLKNVLCVDERWRELLDNKTLAGSSAGADVISAHYYALDSLRCEDGLGILPIKVIPHWRSDNNAPNIDWDRAYTELDAYGSTLPIVTLAEGEFVTR